jgi:hypothetical protein
MSKSVYLNVTPEQVKNAAEVIPREYPDSIIVLAPIFPKSTESPTKKRAYHRIKFEALIPAEAINGEGALDDFGGLLILRLPKKRIQPKFL